jgi:hypothetical protein
MTSGRGPYPVHPFAQVLQINFPALTDITKLDFVNNRYMVRGKTQLLTEVLGDELPPSRIAATQQSWRGSNGLDLRELDGGGFLETVPRTAYLTNKVYPPTTENPGALNEFLRFDYTLIIEFDWEDIVAAREAAAPGSVPNGVDIVYEIFTAADQVNFDYVTLSNTELPQYEPGFEPSDTTATFTFTQVEPPGFTWEVGPYYDTGQTDKTAAASYFVHYNDPDGPAVVGVVFYQDLISGSVWARQADFDVGGIPYGAGPNFFWVANSDTPGAYYGDEFGNPIFSPTQPPDKVVTIEGGDGLPSDEPYTIVPELAVYETNFSGPIDGRILGGHPDTANSTPVPIRNGAILAPYGRVRAAVTLASGGMAVSVNGQPPVAVTAPTIFTMPRPYPSGQEYYTIATVGAFKTLEFYFTFPGLVRCVWLTRTKRFGLDLQKMSKVQPLPPSNSAKWVKLPGQDQ